MTYNKLLDLLRRLHEEFPTEKAKHNITLDLENEKLLLTVFYGEKWYSFTFEDGDMDDTEESIRLMKGFLIK